MISKIRGLFEAKPTVWDRHSKQVYRGVNASSKPYSPYLAYLETSMGLECDTIMGYRYGRRGWVYRGFKSATLAIL